MNVSKRLMDVNNIAQTKMVDLIAGVPMVTNYWLMGRHVIKVCISCDTVLVLVLKTTYMAPSQNGGF